MPPAADAPIPTDARDRLRELHARLPAGAAPDPVDLTRMLELTDRVLADDDAAERAREDAAHGRSTLVVLAAAATMAGVALTVLALAAIGAVASSTATVIAGTLVLLLAAVVALTHLRSGPVGHRRRAALAPAAAGAGVAGAVAAAAGTPMPVWVLLLLAAVAGAGLVAGTATRAAR
ncbi:hypothetical protein [Pseudonocardia spirodelae]|uniref:DUF2157 domain-containing protein n=1 Tax=Pseudonocardia spirodelae TaxID=3133431 RepID=A0ABU8T8G6_9PSEU